jgi:hypothetical protein
MKPTQPKSKPKFKELDNLFNYIRNYVVAINDSKVFAAIIFIILNIFSKFIEFNLSKSMESYLKYTLSRDILVFAIVWTGTREIFMAIFITLLFKLFFDYLFNENSVFCCLSENFTEHYVSLLDNPPTHSKITNSDIKKIKEILKKHEEQQPLQKENE